MTTTKDLTKKQLEILILLYRFRFLNRIHIQQHLNHKNDTRISSWLKNLTDKQIINRIYSQTLGEINKPSIYYLATQSRQILKEVDTCNPDLLKRVYREKTRSPGFRAHCLFIANLYFHFQKAAKHQSSTCSFYTSTDLSDVAYAPLPLPDAYIVIKDDKKTIRYFLDLLDNRPMFLVRKRIDQYVNYFQANYWQNNYMHPFPKILLICPLVRVKNSLLRYIPTVLESEEVEMSFFLGLQDDISKNGIRPETWEKATKHM